MVDENNGDLGIPPLADGPLPYGSSQQVVSPVPASVPDVIVPKSAQEGTLMYRRADVLGRLRRWRTRYLNNMRAAEQQDNEEWRQSQLEKIRAVNSLFDDIVERCPVFENAAKAMETRKGQDLQGLGGDSHDSAVGNADLPKNSQLLGTMGENQ